jgi:hypothetical protein
LGGYVDKLQGKAGEVMRPGEQLVSAIRAKPRGTTTGFAVGGLIGATIAGRQAKKANEGVAEGSVAASWPQAGMGGLAVGLTNQRLLTFSFTAMGKPKDLTGEFPIEQVSSVDMDKRKITNGVRFAFSDGSAVEVECAKLEKVDDFLSAFQGVKGSAG